MFNLQRDFDLQPYNTLACPAQAEYYCAAASLAELTEALRFANEQGLPLHLLGGGSNLLCGAFIPGLTLSPKLMGRHLLSEQGEQVEVELAAGENWHQAVLWCSGQGLYGLENLALIPGSCGAAPIQNIGAYGVEIGQLLSQVVCFNRSTMSLEVLNAEDCLLAYRDSIFKQALRHSHIILAIRLRLSRVFTPDLSYPALNFNGQTPTPQQLLERVINLRLSKLPDPAVIPNAGSFFKNPIVNTEKLAQLLGHYPQMPHYPAPQGAKLAAAWLIEQAGCKGQTYRGITVHPQQALVLTNPAQRPREDVLACAAIIADKVAAGFGVKLEIEPQLLG